MRDNLGDSPKQRVSSLGQQPKALVLRWRQIRTFKFNIFTLNALISTNKVSVLTIKACSENNFGLIQAKFSSLDLIKFVTFFWDTRYILSLCYYHVSYNCMFLLLIGSTGYQQWFEAFQSKS